MKHENKLRTINLTSCRPTSQPSDSTALLPDCSVCSNLIKKPKCSIPCPTCRHLVHKKCSILTPYQIQILKHQSNIWECPTCTKDKFPFSEIEDDEILTLSFNSNWSCNCQKQRPSLPDEKTLTDFKLLLSKQNQNDSSCSNFSGDTEFDEQFDAHHSLKPDFKYYETHCYVWDPGRNQGKNRN